VVPRQRIAEECDLLVDDHPEEPVRVEPGQIESIWLSEPLEELQVRPAIEHVVLVVLDEGARIIDVLWQGRV
jgi:hypothetical protein